MQHKMKDILNGTVSTQDFSGFVQEQMPNFYRHVCQQDLNMYDALQLMHQLSNASFPMLSDDASSTDDDAIEFLHSLKLAVTPHISRIESMFDDSF